MPDLPDGAEFTVAVPLHPEVGPQMTLPDAISNETGAPATSLVPQPITEAEAVAAVKRVFARQPGDDS